MDPTTLASKLINTRDNFTDFYEVGSEIGKGRYATVKKCYCKKTQQIYAAKIIKNFRSKNKMNLNIVENEITALTLTRSHPSIVTLYEVFYDRGETILILEYATEKDLHIYLDCEGAFEEEKACHIIYQVLKALEFLHSKNILHLDIKPENVLLMNPLSPVSSKEANKSDTENNNNNISNNNNNNSLLLDKSTSSEDSSNIKVKLCDFSFSQIMTPGKQVLGMMGTVAYSAPEVLQYEPLTKATDMWSLGVLAHVLLTEYTPFGNGTEKNLQTETNILSVRDKEFKCVEEYFEPVSVEAQDFLENLLQFRPKHRLTVEEALNHAWFKKNLSSLKRNVHNTTLNECCVDCSHEQTHIQNNSSKLITSSSSTTTTSSIIDTPPSPPSSPPQSSSSIHTTTTSNDISSHASLKETSSSSTLHSTPRDTIIMSSLSSSSTSSTSSIENTCSSSSTTNTTANGSHSSTTKTTTSLSSSRLFNSNTTSESVKTKLDQVEANLLASDDFLSLEALTKSLQNVNSKNYLNNTNNNKSETKLFESSSSLSSSNSAIQNLIKSTTNFKLENSSSSSSSSSSTKTTGQNSHHNNNNINNNHHPTATEAVLASSRLLNIAELATQFCHTE